jgi:Capsule assembly protein Wzi
VRPSLLVVVLFSLLILNPGALLSAPASSAKSPIGPVFVPLDSWVYPVFRRLAAMGYVPDEENLAAPWTREQCLTLVEEAEDIASRHDMKIEAGASNGQALQMIAALKREFERDANRKPEARIESLYGGLTGIAGSPLNDSYHFGQTLVNNYGRPYQEGANTYDGFSAYGTAGRFSGYFRGEYQEASGRAPYSSGIQDLIGTLDGVPPSAPSRVPSTSKFDPLEMYLGVKLGLFAVTFGKQSSWWGPDQASAFSFSNNAEPMYSLKVSQQAPFVLPGPFRYLGHIRTEFLVGKLAGHLYPPRPLINAQKITFQLTPSFEIGFTRSAIFGGVGHPLTTGSFLRSIFSTSSTGGTAFGSRNDPGDRRSGFDFLWRVPGVSRFVTIYSDSLADDEPSPLSSPHRSAWAPGIYLTQIPGIRRLDLRFETYATYLYRGDEGGMFFYWNNQYRDAYTNDGFLLGSWVGRDARAYVTSSSYWWSAKNKITFGFRQVKTGGNFLPGGGTQTDVSVTGQWEIRPNLIGSAFVQYERYLIPALGGPEKDVASGFQFTYYPGNWMVRH